MDQTVSACKYITTSCLNFMKVNDLIIKMVDDHYFDLQMMANYVFDIDNDTKPLSKENNFYTRIIDVQKQYDPKYPDMPLFTDENMIKLELIVKDILHKLSNNLITKSKYLSDIVSIEFFGSGAVSSTILLKVYQKVSENQVMPLIVKIIPFRYPEHYNYIPLDKTEANIFITQYIEAPGYALFLKEAWMYCFSKNELAKYTPTFTCIDDCYIIEGLPVSDIQSLSQIYDSYSKRRIEAGKSLPYKKWFNTLLDENSDLSVREAIFKAKYGCFEMQQIDGILEDISQKEGVFNLSMIFEYLYTKVVAAFIGKIIFTDDHFGNVAYSMVDYGRIYKIKCNGLQYKFYMPPGKMVQFIDLERYVFNYSPYDIYTNSALERIPEKDFQKMRREISFKKSEHLDEIKSSYTKNNYIFDKSLSSLLDGKVINEKSFSDPKEYKIMLQILTSSFIHDIKTFCQIMEINLPDYYLKPINGINSSEHYLDLDDRSLQVIKNVL